MLNKFKGVPVHRPVISVIIPVYNHADSILLSIESVLHQTFENFELVLVNDGSEDDLICIISSIKDERFRFINHNVNKGAAAARNTGISNAKGEYIAFLDADDYWAEDKLELQLNYLIRAPKDIPGCCTDFNVLQKNNIIESNDKSKRILDLNEITLGCSCSPGSTLMVKRHCFEEIGKFCTEFSRFEDWDWLLLYAKKYRLGIVDSITTTIKRGRLPNYPDTIHSIKLMKQRHLSNENMPYLKVRISFLSSLLVEIAAANYRRGYKLKAFCYTTLSLLIYPARNYLFFKKILARGIYTK